MKAKRGQQESKALQELLRDLRLAANLRQEDVAERLHVPQSFVSKYEGGERRLDILELRCLCQLFGLNLQEFVSRLEEKLKDIRR